MIRWGIIGAGNIANRFAKGLSHDTRAVLYAVACRTLEKAQAFKKNHPCEKVYDSYDALLDDSNIDVVYIALPHGHHFAWTKKAIRKGKAVLCEKPAMMNASEMKEIRDLSNAHSVFFMEALKTRFVPLYQEIEEIVKQGIIGDITNIQARYCSFHPYTAESYLYDPYQGGCLLDTGIYNIGYVDTFLKGEFHVEKVSSKVHENGVDTYIHATITFGKATAIIECALDRQKSKQAIITGTKGNIVIDALHRPQVATINLTNHTPYIIEKAYEYDDFYSQIHHVNTCLQQNVIESPIMSKNDSLRCAKLIDAIKRAIV